MTVTASSEVTDRAPSPVCGLCGHPMAADQEWCLECGAARTVIARPFNRKRPMLAGGVVVLLAVVAVVVAVTQLGGSSSTPTSAAGGSTTRPGRVIGSWQPGLDGYTVVLDTAASQAAADRAATRLTSHIADLGVLSTSQHPEMTPQGVWEVYAGRYPTYLLAQTAAARAVHAGYATAKPSLVQHPGGG